jgi:flagellar hook-associated protein 1 FlgK
MLANLQSALTTYADSPTSSSAADAVVTAAQNLTQSLKAGDSAVNQVREQADQGMASSVSTINSLLAQFQTANNAVVIGLETGANVSSAEDTRDSIVTQLAQQIGVSTTTAANGSESIYTDSGVTLFQETARTVSFTPTSTYAVSPNGNAVSGNAVTIDGVPVTGPNSPMPIQSGALAGYAALRDTLAPEYQAQLDQIAGGLINAFSETGPSGANAALPGLFTFTTSGTSLSSTSLPLSMSATTGLAAEIKVNPLVDPSQGGDPSLLQNGVNSANPAYDYNPGGSDGASYTGYIHQLVAATQSTQSFDDSAAQLGTTSATLSDYTNASVSWLQGQNQQASDKSSYQNALATQATSALSNATGVNLDAEMTIMLTLENTYASTAKLLTTVNTMFSALLQAA